MKIGIYTICKNEIKNLDIGFEHLKDADEICIIDTGSTDGTYERLQELSQQYSNLHIKQKVFEPFYFDVARNAALDFIKLYLSYGDIVFHFDLDEEVEENFISKVKEECLDKEVDTFIIWDANGGNAWKGHRILPNLRWGYHIHEKIININNIKSITSYITHLHYTHHQDTNKPRNYRELLRVLVDLNPHCIHYLTYSLVEEAMLPDNEEKCTLLGLKIAEEILSNVEDEHFYDAEWLTYALMYLPSQYNKFSIECLEKVLGLGYGTQYKRLHWVLADKYKEQKDFIKAELHFLECLKLPVASGWIDTGFSEKNLLFSIVMFYYYDKKDFISASFYAKLCKDLYPNEEVSGSNLNYCLQAQEEKQSWVLLLTNNTYIDGVITTVRTLQKTNTRYPISILVTKDVYIDNINILLQLGLHVFLVDKIKPNNNYNEIEIDELVSLNQPGYHSALSKFYIYNLVQFDKIVYLDSDIWILKNFDDLFNYPNGAALQDVYGTLDIFCSGLLVIEPSEETYNKLLDYFYNLPQTEELIHDQAVLQGFFKDYWFAHPELVIPIDYNLWATYYEGKIEGRNLYDDYYYNLRDIKSYHIIDKKPGTHGKQYYISIQDTYPCYSSVLLRYIEVINYCIKELKNKGIDSPYLKYIE